MPLNTSIAVSLTVNLSISASHKCVIAIEEQRQIEFLFHSNSAPELGQSIKKYQNSGLIVQTDTWAVAAMAWYWTRNEETHQPDTGI